MKAEQLEAGNWFRRDGDGRVWVRLEGEPKVIEQTEAVPVKPLQPTLRQPEVYIPRREEVKLHEGQIIKLS